MVALQNDSDARITHNPGKERNHRETPTLPRLSSKQRQLEQLLCNPLSATEWVSGWVDHKIPSTNGTSFSSRILKKDWINTKDKKDEDKEEEAATKINGTNGKKWQDSRHKLNHVNKCIKCK